MSTGSKAGVQIARFVPLTACLVGTIAVLGNVALCYDDFVRRAVGATLGVTMLLLGVWYTANPFLASTRKYVRLRAEVVRFVGLVKDLNKAVVADQVSHMDEARKRLHDAVERIVDAAGKAEQAPVVGHTRERPEVPA